MIQSEIISEKWIPSPTIKTHTGNTIPQDLLFFCQPPDGIGNVISAYSTAKNGKQLASPAKIWVAMGCCVLLGLMLGVLVNSLTGIKPVYDSGWTLWLPIAILFIFIKFGIRFFPTDFECTFVGDQGWARISIDRKQIKTTQLLFNNCSKLFTKLWFYYKNGRSGGPFYELHWLDSNNMEVGKLSEYANSSIQTLPDNHILHFVIAAERSWTNFFSPKAKGVLQTGGTVTFSLKNSNSKKVGAIQLTSTDIRIQYEDSYMSIQFSDMEPVEIFHENFGTGGKEECVMIRKKDVAKHIWGQTTLTIPISAIENAQFLLDELAKE